MVQEKNSFTLLQAWSAVFSTASCIMIGLILNIVWDMKEWKGQKDHEDMTQNESLANLTLLIVQDQKENKEFGNRLIYLEAIMPKEFKIKLNK